MYAVIEAGGHQYRVKKGDTLNVEKLAGDVGDTVVFDRVLLLASEDGQDVRVGAPYVASAKVSATIEKQTRAKKIIVFKYKRRKNYKRTRGHRQHLTTVKIELVA